MTVSVEMYARRNQHAFALVCSRCGNIDYHCCVNSSLPHSHVCGGCGVVAVTRKVRSLWWLLRRTREDKEGFRRHYCYVINRWRRDFQLYEEMKRRNQT